MSLFINILMWLEIVTFSVMFLWFMLEYDLFQRLFVWCIDLAEALFVGAIAFVCRNRMLAVVGVISFTLAASLPPMPPGIVKVVRSPKGTQQVAESGTHLAKTPLVVVLPPHTNNVTLAWSYTPTAGVAFQVYGTSVLSSNFLQLATVTTNGYHASLTNQQFYFKVRAVNTNSGLVSAWATK